MQPLKFISRTWLLSLLLHPLTMAGFALLFPGTADPDMIWIVLCSSVASLPALLLSMQAFRLLYYVEEEGTAGRFSLWLLLISGAILLNAALLALLAGLEGRLEEVLLLTVPAVAAAWTASATLYREFKRFFMFSNP